MAIEEQLIVRWMVAEAGGLTASLRWRLDSAAAPVFKSSLARQCEVLAQAARHPLTNAGPR